MNAIKFIKDHGVEKARGVVESAPAFPVFGYCALTGSYIFKRKDATAYYHNETNSWSEEYALELILLNVLKRIVDSVDLVKRYGGIAEVKTLHQDEFWNERVFERLKQAIADYELINEVK